MGWQSAEGNTSANTELRMTWIGKWKQEDLRKLERYRRELWILSRGGITIIFTSFRKLIAKIINDYMVYKAILMYDGLLLLNVNLTILN